MFLYIRKSLLCEKILSYLEDYDQAVEEYKKADALDPLLPAKKDIQIIKNNVIKTYNYIQSKVKL